ncbi:hypothetical protein BN946_scf185043.g70 [Trametes cinnabarina]|uniref:Peptidase A1 domain-containing protein n=1 Tax=Pycnoporus cinnabarinus TaxID=5643 RepID=A0A060SIJ6_PYCCI|nr:hypothetical protein BN946_scf185043.g70 [Trametes cinnabarina]
MVITVFTLLVSATPVLPDDTTTIRFQRRNTLTRADNTFDHDHAIRQNVKIINKYRANLINMQRNTGRLPVNVVSVPPLANLSHMLLGKRQTVPLTDLDGDSEWAGNISIGDPPTTFFIDIDTGSSDLWVPSLSCAQCGSKAKYDPSASSGSVAQNVSFQIQYGDGSTAAGSVYTDKVTVGGIAATNQFFAAVTQESSEFVNDPADGILGLGFPPISNLNQDPFLITAFKQHPELTNVFAIKLEKTNSELHIGDLNVSAFTGAIEYHNLSSADGFWQIGNAAALVNGRSVVSGFQTVIDSGTTIMYGPPDAVQEVYQTVNGSTLFDETNGFWSYPCATPPQIAFSWGESSWGIRTENWDLGETAVGSGRCVGALAGQDLGLGSDVWLLGDSFMKNVYTAFSFEAYAVGFAALA